MKLNTLRDKKNGEFKIEITLTDNELVRAHEYVTLFNDKKNIVDKAFTLAYGMQFLEENN